MKLEHSLPVLLLYLAAFLSVAAVIMLLEKLGLLGT